MTTEAALSRGLLPAEPFVRIARERADLEAVAQILELSGRCLYRLINENRFISFDHADKIVTRCHPFGALGWFVDDELSELYQSVNLEPADRLRPCAA